MPLRAKVYISVVSLAGLGLLVGALREWSCANPGVYFCCVCLAVLASSLKVTLPGIKGTMSVNHVFILLSVMEFSRSETILMASAAIGVQTWWRAKGGKRWAQLLFNCCSMALAASSAYRVYHALEVYGHLLPLAIAAAASAFFVVNTMSVAGVVSLTESKNLLKTWHECYFWSFAYYLVGAGIAGIISVSSHRLGWQVTLLGMPVVYAIFRSYRLYLGKLESEKNHAEAMADLHLRTIEALALAIEAKDTNTSRHLQRVQVYAVEMGKAMGLDNATLQALQAASILHDIGKLAVPEHIISKPGKLTPEEFDKMKIHPVVGAEILERVQFPYPVVPIVRSHHERWNGAGYPDGLKDEGIPIGARILSAVDCLDALASDRQYRKALPLDQAMAMVVAESAKSFDPRVVSTLQANYKDWEKLAWSMSSEQARLSTQVQVVRGDAPAAGLDTNALNQAEPQFLTSIAAARQEVQGLFELTQDLGNSLNLHETLSVLDSRLHRLIPYDTLAVYTNQDTRLTPAYVNGDSCRLFSSIQIAVGEGVSGWVAASKEPIVNGNPAAEFANQVRPGCPRSAIAVPLECQGGSSGVLTLYHADADAFTRDHLRVLLAISPKVALAIDNATRYEQASISATIDSLTSLPNARSLFQHLDRELARAAQTGAPLAVLVCDLDGFKLVNDRFGHLEGNRVLAMIAAGLQESCMEGEYVARMGGDEFVLVLPGCDRQQLDERIDQWREMARAAGHDVCAEPLLDISIGAAFLGDDGADAEALLAAADRAMYMVKKAHKTPLPSLAPGLAALDQQLRRDVQAPTKPLVVPAAGTRTPT